MKAIIEKKTVCTPVLNEQFTPCTTSIYFLGIPVYKAEKVIKLTVVNLEECREGVE